ncbi:MAG: hypothetical protein ACRDJC_15065, partial [Thermomicrobiales bacterium]
MSHTRSPDHPITPSPSALPVRLAIVGCKGMGRRHLAGLARTDHNRVGLAAVCVLNESRSSTASLPRSIATGGNRRSTGRSS